MTALFDGVPGWLLALVPLAALAVVVGSIVAARRRAAEESAEGPSAGSRASWLWPVLVAVGAFAALKLLTDR